MGTPWVLSTPEQVEAFKADWALGMPLAEMAALHGYTNLNGVTRAAKRLGLPLRPGGPKPAAPTVLRGGRWVSNGRVQVWIDDDEVAS